MNKLIASLAFAAIAVFGLATSASAQSFNPRDNVTINVITGCGCKTEASPSRRAAFRPVIRPTREAARPAYVAPPVSRLVRNVQAPAPTPSFSTLKCESSATIATYKVRWPKDGNVGINNQCTAAVSATDLANVAAQAAKGTKRMRIALTISTGVCRTGEATMPVEINGNYIDLFAWRKHCKL